MIKNNVKVLLVEGYEELRIQLEKFLRRFIKCEHVSTNNYYKAKELLEKEKFDLIISSYRLKSPDKTGEDVMELVKGKVTNHEMKAILLTGTPDLIDKGFYKIVTKPFVAHEFIELLKNKIDKISFFKEIHDLKEEGFDLFYNLKGNSTAYKLFIRHIGFAPNLNYGEIRNNVFIPNKEIYLVDFDNLTISTTTNSIEIIKLEEID